jgi:hypothetical protein
MADESPSIKVSLPKYLADVADRAAEKAAKAVIEEHLKICEARKTILPNASGKPGMDVRVDRLEQTHATRTGWMLIIGTAGIGVLGKLFFDLIIWLRTLGQGGS